MTCFILALCFLENLDVIHSQTIDSVNFEELARCTDDFNGAQLKAVCVEAGMLALRRDGTCVCGFARERAYASTAKNGSYPN